MGIVASIEDAVQAPSRLAFAEFETVTWHQRLESDAATGKPDALATP